MSGGSLRSVLWVAGVMLLVRASLGGSFEGACVRVCVVCAFSEPKVIS